MNFIIDPVVTLMEKMNFAKRFLLICILIFASLALVSFMYIDNKINERQFLIDELASAKHYETIVDIMKKVEAASVLEITANNKADVQKQLLSIDNEVDTALLRLKESMNTGWKTERINQTIQVINSNWNKIKNALENGSNNRNEIYTQNVEIEDELSDLLLAILNDSNLDLDIDPMASNLIDVFIKYGPNLAQKTSSMRDLALESILDKELTTQNRGELYSLLGLIEYENNRVLESIDRLKTMNTAYGNALSEHYDVVAKKLASQSILTHVLQPANITVDYANFHSELSKYVDNYFALSDTAYKLFLSHQTQRIHAIEQSIMYTVGCLMLILIAIGIIFLAFYRSTERAVKNLIEIADVMSKGDLSQNLDISRVDEFGILTRALDKMQRKIFEIIRQIKTTSNTVGKGAAEISQGNLDLSKRTEEQASSLASTAASMQELSITVRENATQSKKAAELAQSAREQADTGGNVVNDAVAAMTLINASSKKIAEISGVIEEIAFQTNLLALNAAIEAARAGEQGRGFTVVAQEVRNLAQRSSKAAKEISTLITESVDKISSGTELVNKSGDALQEIVKSSITVSEIVASIASATTQQAKGLEEINKAITQMDGITQQNAALVEETAATSENVNNRVQELIKQIEFFKSNQIEHSLGSDFVSRNTQANKQPTSSDEPSIEMAHFERKGADQDWKEF